jgi:hypothetical protein
MTRCGENELVAGGVAAILVSRGTDATRARVRVDVLSPLRCTPPEPLSKSTVRGSCLLCNMNAVVQSLG